MSGASFKAPGGKDPTRYLLELTGKAQPTEGDAIYAAQRQRSRIIERTMQGVDVDGRPFAPYSTKGPYYYYPNGRVGNAKFSSKQNKAAVNRLMKKIGNREAEFMSLPEHVLKRIPGLDENADTGARKTRSGMGIRFPSYAAFKAALGRATVDLLGPRAPHMLQAIVVRINGAATADRDVGVNSRPSPATQVTIGIYGQEADRASGHNQGISGRLPQRRFFGASVSDLAAMVSDIKTRILARVKGKA